AVSVQFGSDFFSSRYGMLGEITSFADDMERFSKIMREKCDLRLRFLCQYQYISNLAVKVPFFNKNPTLLEDRI
ncbi:MAG: hypothetical protein II564_03885, partial [Oscillospiraceae bacterium]|nr:hypothetical protein [Oscillospiraceae bacterium]